MRALNNWSRGRKTVASSLVVALLAGVPLTVAALHPGFPVTDVDLTSRDVWVTNGDQLLAGRLNRQIDEINASVATSESSVDLLQDADALFLHDPALGRLDSVDAASTEVSSAIDVPTGSRISYADDRLAIVSPEGDLWSVSAVGDLQFNYVSTPPMAELGEGGRAVVTDSGAVVAISPDDRTLLRWADPLGDPESLPFPALGDFQLAAVGDRVVALDTSINELFTDDGEGHPLGGEKALQLQQSGPESSRAVLATGASLLSVDLESGEVSSVPADIEPATDADGVAAPANVAGCAHGAWSHAQRYALDCTDGTSESREIPDMTAGDRPVFRVNGDIVVLNELNGGNVWLPDEDMRLVENWEDVVPPEEEESDEVSDETSATESFEDTLAERTDENRPPTANDDTFGIRPGRTTILPLLDNDSDPDGDVLVIPRFGEVNEATGRLESIDGDRALQFTPAPDFVGSISFDYTIDDGRGGTDTASVTARVVPEESNEEPFEIRRSGVSVEAEQTVAYNVLSNWRDPDGDDLFLVGAAPQSGDLVRFAPNGDITFTHQTEERGEKEVRFQVSDGVGAPITGTLIVTVEDGGALNPVGTPDFATVFTGESVVVEPLENDLSPSGAPLSLLAIEEPEGDATAELNPDRGTVTVGASTPGIFYMKYTVQAGQATSVGIIRVDVVDLPEQENPPPVAVKDTAYLRGEEPVEVSVLSNDVSPAGRILAVQSIEVPQEVRDQGLVVELLESTLIRVTAPTALTGQVDFDYTISDGISTSTAGVTVVPLPALTKHQPPIASPDTATVRVGDVVGVDVLRNDVHPDDSSMFVSDELVTAPEAGLAFVSDDMVRFQAPDEPGSYSVDYRVEDPYGETAASTVTFTVTALDDDANQDPVPDPLVGRVLAGGTARIDIPLQNLDPDGDSLELTGFPSNPSLGSVIESGSDYLLYQASTTAVGTDVFEYEVADVFGATGTAEIKIAVIPEPTLLQNPIAAPDEVAVRPGRLAQVDLLANDSDPQGAPIKVSPSLVDVPDGISAEVRDERYLVVQAPEVESSFSLRYELTNNRGGRAMSYVLVTVSPDAPLLPPTARDVPIGVSAVVSGDPVSVDVFDGFAFNPSGRTEDLVVSLEGPNAGAGSLSDVAGRIVVTPSERRQAVAYRVTNEADELSAWAFILIPAIPQQEELALDQPQPPVEPEQEAAEEEETVEEAAPEEAPGPTTPPVPEETEEPEPEETEEPAEELPDPPTLDPDLEVQYVGVNETKTWKVGDVVVAPSGRAVRIADPSSVRGVQSKGSNYVDEKTLTFTPPLDYRGPAAIDFTVTDGDGPDDERAVSAKLRLEIVVGDPEFRDTPPEFTTPTVEVEVGESTTVDLRDSTGHPNPEILAEVAYLRLTGADGDLQASLDGSRLTATTPRDAVKGATSELGVTLRWDRFEVEGSIRVRVVASTRPMAVAVADELETQRGDGAVTLAPLTNDSNPFQTTGEALKLVSAQLDSVAVDAGTGASAAQVALRGDQVTITPSAALKAGTITVVYVVEDATGDPDRRVNGTIVLVVSDVPDQPNTPSVPAQGDEGAVQIGFTAPAANGKPISSYEVRSEGGGTMPTGCTPPGCTITGLENGTAYSFSVRAINSHGPGEWSAFSAPVTPYGTPGTPTVSMEVQEQWAPGGAWQASWSGVDSNGGSVRYEWRVNGGGWNATAGTATGRQSGQAGGTYTVEVRAINSGGKVGTSGMSQGGVITQQGVPPQVSITAASPASGSYAPQTVTWQWAGVTANPGGAANLRYEIRYNGGGAQNVGTATSHSIGGAGVGEHRLEVRAVNKAGAGPWSGASAVRLDQQPPPPDPPVVSLCRYPGQGSSVSGGSGDLFGINWSGQSGGSHTMKVDNPSNAFRFSHTASGASGHVKTQSWANTGGANNSAQFWVTFDGVDQGHTTMGQIPSC